MGSVAAGAALPGLPVTGGCECVVLGAQEVPYFLCVKAGDLPWQSVCCWARVSRCVLKSER
eukprot:scaffold13372_cov21-Tisochrysis_lutea.AAC.1